MSEVRESEESGAGCLFIIGATIVAICIGNLYEAIYGWLAFGSVLILLGLISAMGGSRNG